MSTHSSASDAAKLFGDRILLLAIAIGAVASLILGFQSVDTSLAVVGTLVFVVVGGGAANAESNPDIDDWETF